VSEQNKKSLYFLLIGVFFIFLNFNIAQTITPMYILDIGGTEFHSGLQSTLFYLTAVLLRFYFGPLADRHGNRITLFIGGLAFMTAPLLFLFNQSLVYVLLVRMYQAIGLGAFFSSASSLVSALAPKEKLGAYIGFYRLVTMLSLLVGPSLAVKVIHSSSYFWYHILGFVAGLLAMIFLHFVQEPARTGQESIGKASRDYRMVDLLKSKRLLPIYQAAFLVAVLFGLLQTFSGIFVAQVYSTVNPGLFFTIFGLGSIVANLTAGYLSDSKGRAQVAFPCVMAMGLGVAVLALLPYSKLILVFGSIVAGFGFAGAISVLITWVIDEAPSTSRTSALALQDNAIDIGIAVGSFLFGIIIPLVGLSWTYALGGIILILFIYSHGNSIRKKHIYD
jgi:MFS family permease